MKELTPEEVLRIAGGVPTSAALDELTYGTPGEAAPDAVESTRLMGSAAVPCQGD
jgi:hypothetical protein